MDFDLNNLILKDVFNFASDGIFILDKEWKIVAMNYAAETISGWTKSEVESQRLCTEIFLCFDQEGNQICEGSCPKQTVMQEKAGGAMDSLEVKVMTKSGQPVILSGQWVSIPETAGASYAAIMIKNDIEKLYLEERLLAGERLDPLTHLYHRQYFEELYHIEARRAQRHGGTVALLMLDIEKLQEINNKLGSKAGDEVLKGAGKVINETIRDVDVAARYGEDEYIILLYGADEIKAQKFIQRLREKIQKWNGTKKIPIEVRFNTSLMVSDRDFEVLPERMKEIIDGHKGVPL